MSTPNRYRIRQTPTDVWSIRERLCLASSVLRSGDQNWVSVSRAIKPFGEPNRPPDWFSQKNCALQYSDLLEKVETPKRKRWDRADKETPGDLIVRKLTMERAEELKKLIQERQIKHRKLKRDIEMVRCGHLDDKLDDLLNQIKDEMKAADEAEKEHQKWLQQREEQIAALKAMPRIASALPKRKIPGKISRVGELKRRNSSQSEQSEQDSAVESPISEPHSIEVDDAVSPSPTAFEGIPCTPTKMAPPSSASTSQHPTPSTSPLLTSLLKSPTPTAPASPIGSILGSPSSQPKEGTLASQLTSPRSISTPQPFFNPTSALATAAARQLAVATAALAPSSSSLFPSDKQDSSPSSSASSVPPVHSVTLSAPTLSKLLEMPPSVPGKLPPLPIVHPPTPTSSAGSTPSAIVNIHPKPVETPASISEREIPVKESSSVVPPVKSVAETGTSGKEKIISVAVKVEPPENVSVPSVPEETAGTVCHEASGEKKEDIATPPAKILEPCSPTSAVVEKSAEIELNKNSVMHSTDIVIEGKGSDSAQGEEQVIVMEVDFAGEVKDEKGEIIEVFEVTAPEGSIVELEYETICEDEEPSKVEQHLEIRQEEKPLDGTIVPSGETSDLQVTVATSETKENENVPVEADNMKDETQVLDVKVPEGDSSKVPDQGHVKDAEEHGVNTAVEMEPGGEKSVEEEKNTAVECHPEESETSQNISVGSKTEKEDHAVNEQDESELETDKLERLEYEANAKPNIGNEVKEMVQFPDVEETKDDDSSVSQAECLPVHEDKSISLEPMVKEEPADEIDEEAEEEQTTPMKKNTEEKDEPIKEEKLVEAITKAVKRSSKKGRRGRGRGGGKTFTDIEVGPKPFQDDICKSKDDEDEDDNERKMEMDRVESAAESETSEVVSLVDHSVESTVEPVSDLAAEASGDSDENFTANEGEDISKDMTGNESPEEESAADQSQISAESEDKLQAPSSVTDSIPNSPASTAPSDDQETIREYKVWKKAIMLVWRAAANHKFANVFLHPVTNDVAPGYHGIVYRPMDLSVIKKNIENGHIRSTMEFQRDMMLMFQNAIMYNNSDHDVYHMALEMQKEVMEQIQDFLATQLMLQTVESKVLRVREREARERKLESADKESDMKRKRTSAPNSDTEVKVKKRKI